MTEALRDYRRRLRAGLAGLPRPDIDDLVEEMCSHLADEIAEGRPASEAVADFGDPAVLAAEIVARRLRPENAPPVAPASRARRFAASLADLVAGWGPLIVLPVWLELIGWIQVTFLLPRDLAAQLTATYGEHLTSVPLWMALVAGGFLTWGLYYRRLVERSMSVGMRMAGISRFRVYGEQVVVRTADVAESEPGHIVAGAKWYLAPPLALLGLITALAAFYYAAMAVGSFAQPSEATLHGAVGYQDFSRAEAVLKAFYDAVVAGDVPAAQALAEKGLSAEVAALVERAKAGGITRAERGMNLGEASYVMHEYYPDGRPPRVVVLTLSRHDEQSGPADFATVYRVSSIEETTQP